MDATLTAIEMTNMIEEAINETEWLQVEPTVFQGQGRWKTDSRQ
jgi:hypothetical protein